MRKQLNFPEQKKINGYQRRMRVRPTKAERQFQKEVLIPLKKRFGIIFVAQKMFLETKTESDYKGYIFDFFLPAYKMCIEIDGKSHNGEKAQVYDAIKASYAAKKGHRVIRFTNDEVKNADKCIKALYQEINQWEERQKQLRCRPKQKMDRGDELRLQEEFIASQGVTKCPLVGERRKALLNSNGNGKAGRQGG